MVMPVKTWMEQRIETEEGRRVEWRGGREEGRSGQHRD
jgi:hypothetical protein